MKNIKLNQYDIVEITWLDSRSGGGWKSPSEVEEWIKIGRFQITLLQL